MGLKRSLRQNIELSYNSIKESKGYMNDAVKTINDTDIKEQIQRTINQITDIENQCEIIAKKVKDF